ncbi:hypothetical protein ABEB36_013543 [Hypothenemus hampei]|uniref:Peptidase A2 domain-containing protein n=1 Tax=Hypothenemus hampei TaxID=57062 RepID=A0ABD1E4H9_HYPHA
MNHRSSEGQSLYDFLFYHVTKIDNLRLNISEPDKICLILGVINDHYIKSAVEAARIKNINELASYLRNKVHKKGPVVKPVVFGPSRSVDHKPTYKLANLKDDKRKICNFCKTLGHIETACHKNNTTKAEKTDLKIENVQLVSEDTSKKFCKIFVNEKEITALIDLGSDCSVMQKNLSIKLGLPVQKLSNPVILSGFAGEKLYIYDNVTADVSIDRCVLNVQIYVTNQILNNTEIIIGRNFTENKNISYQRINDKFTFHVAKVKETSFEPFNICHGDVDDIQKEKKGKKL